MARERVGVEIVGCLDGPNPLQAFTHLLQMSAFPIVFQAPEIVKEQIGPDYGEACVASLELASPLLCSDPDVVRLVALLPCSFLEGLR